MFKAERREKIKTLMLKQKQLDVASLSKLLNVTEVTIRSDLEYLEQQGFLKRLHGGAILNEVQNSLLSPIDLGLHYDAERAATAKLAASLIEENDRIFLGSGETSYYISQEIADIKQLTVLTNNLYVAYVLADNPNIQLTITGGHIIPGLYFASGDMFHKTINNLFLNKAFISVPGVDLDVGYTVASSYEISIFREISVRSERVILSLVPDKFDTVSYVKLDNLDAFSTVVCAGNVPQPYVDYYINHDIKLILPKKITEDVSGI